MKTANRFVAFLLICMMVLGVGVTAAAEEELVTLRIMAPSNTYTADGEQVTGDEWIHGDSRMVNALNEALASYGIQVEYDLIPSDQYQVVCQTRLATGLDCDIINIKPLETKTRVQLIEQGELLPINKILEEYSDGTAIEFFANGDGVQEAKLVTLEDGNQYWVTAVTRGDFEGGTAGNTMSFMIRKDWVDALDMSMPTTIDELYDVLVAFQENDMNGNGEKDEVISVSLSKFQTGIAQWFGIGPEITYIDLAEGTVKTPWQSENVKNYIEFMKRLYTAGLIDTSDQVSQKCAENKISGIFSWTTDTWSEASVVVPEGADMACYVPVMCTAVEGLEPSVLRQSGIMLGSENFAVTSECENLEAVASLIDFVTSEEYSVLTEWGIKDYTYVEDAEGNRTKITGDTFEQKYMSTRNAPWTSIYPRHEMVNREAEAKSVMNGAGDNAAYLEDLQAKADMALSLLGHASRIPHETVPNLAVETLEEIDTVSAIATDLNTYSEELLTRLILGEAPLEDWDAYMADFERMGLNDYVAVHQARYERAQ